MTAKEMFEKLGFKTKEGENGIEYQKEWVGYIGFDIKSRIIQTTFYIIEFDVIKAMEQQMKELGWLDD